MKQFVLLIASLLLLGAGCSISPPTEITVADFESCVVAGNAIIKTNPPQCEHNGELFVLELSDTTATSTNDTTTSTDTTTSLEETVVTNFNDCVAAGNPVMESYPRKCKHENTTYIEEVSIPVDTGPQPTAQIPATSRITLSSETTENGTILIWNVDGIDTSKGFKVVRGNSPNPKYGTDDATYLSNPDARSYTFTYTDGETYHFRVCAYTGDGCTNYSNSVYVTTPVVETQKTSNEPNVRSIALSAGSNNTITWQTSGNASKGFKITYSKNPNPVYPKRNEDDNWIFVWDPEASSWQMPAEQGPGTYYVRVCEYIGNACGTYSNEISLVLE